MADLKRDASKTPGLSRREFLKVLGSPVLLPGLTEINRLLHEHSAIFSANPLDIPPSETIDISRKYIDKYTEQTSIYIKDLDKNESLLSLKFVETIRSISHGNIERLAINWVNELDPDDTEDLGRNSEMAVVEVNGGDQVFIFKKLENNDLGYLNFKEESQREIGGIGLVDIYRDNIYTINYNSGNSNIVRIYKLSDSGPILIDTVTKRHSSGVDEISQRRKNDDDKTIIKTTDGQLVILQKTDEGYLLNQFDERRLDKAKLPLLYTPRTMNKEDIPILMLEDKIAFLATQNNSHDYEGHLALNIIGSDAKQLFDIGIKDQTMTILFKLGYKLRFDVSDNYDGTQLAKLVIYTPDELEERIILTIDEVLGDILVDNNLGLAEFINKNFPPDIWSRPRETNT